MATNEILQFAETDTGTNLLTQAEYLADAQRPIGNQPGVARSKLVNKALRQSSLIAAAVAQFVADNQANNVVDTADPVDIAGWIEVAVRSIGIPTAVAGGTADAITADFTPNVALTNGTAVIVRAGAANTTTTPTFAPDGLTAKTIVKGNNLALVAGDIAGAGHWLEMNFDTALDKWVLKNPATGIAPVAQQTGEICFFARNTAPTGFLKANGAAISRTVYASLFAAIGTTFGGGDYATTFNLPDLRGEFVRGWDDGRGVDVGRVLGSAQAGGIQSHTHEDGVQQTGTVGTGYPGSFQGGAGYLYNKITAASGGTETRPRNVAALACIKY